MLKWFTTRFGSIRSIRHLVRPKLRCSVPPLLVTCEGSLQYRFASHLATLDKDVLVYRTDPQGFVDSLNCDRLDLQFTKDPAVIAAAKSAGMNSGQIALKTITASGQEVLAKSSAYQMTAIGEKLIFDLPERRLTMIKNRGVELTFQDAEIFTPRFEVMLDEQGQLRQAECAGPGQIKYHELESTRTESPVSTLARASGRRWK